MSNANLPQCVIVGASHAGAQCALRLRRLGFSGGITLVGAETHTPYHRPPLTKDYLKGTKPFERILLSPAAAYEKAGVTLRLGRRATGIDRAHGTVQIEGGETLPYDHLVLATGSRARVLDVPGADLPGVHRLRSLDDVDRIRERVRPGARCVVVGAGYIGLETAASLRAGGLDVHVVEAQSRVLERVTCPVVSEFFTRVHGEEGVQIELGARLEAFEGDGAVSGVRLAGGEVLAADLVVVGVGIEPNVELARAAGLTVDNGICVDEHCRTSDAQIFAAGDCASFNHPLYAGRVRLESVQNANDQALTVAKALCGDPAPYEAVPWFWSDQYDVKLQIAGLARDYDEHVVRNDPHSGRQFSVVYLRAGRVIAVDAVNRAMDFVAGKNLIADASAMDLHRLADPEVKLKDAVLG